MNAIGDTRPCDRGAFFRNQIQTYIMLPPNEIVLNPLNITSTFSIIMWINPMYLQLFYLTLRVLDASNYFYMKQTDTTSNLRGRIIKAGLDSNDNTGTQPISEKWNFIALINQDNVSSFYCNGHLDFTINQNASYSETGSYTHYIGYITDSFQGMVWSFGIYDESVTLNDFFELSHTVGNCLVKDCKSFCEPAIVENGNPSCISEFILPKYRGDGTVCNGCNNGCVLSTCYDCSSCSTKGCYMNVSTEECICHNGTESQVNCSCPNGKFLSLSDLGCADCYGECSTCSEQNICKSCYDTYAEVHPVIGCTCATGYYNTTALIKGGACSKCLEECETCSAPFKCDICITQNSVPKSDKGCECLPGYYNTSSLINEIGCFICEQNCSVCENEGICLECLYLYMNIQDGSCTCPYNTLLIKNSCTPNEGYFIQKDANGYYAEKCHASCKSCTHAEETSCITCADNYFIYDNLCITECQPGQYYNSLECLNCQDECLTCEEKYNCLTCKNSSKTAVNGTCNLDCGPGFYSNNEECFNCKPLCSICANSFDCINCTNNSEIINNSCNCSEGFYEDDNECVKMYFEFKLSVSTKNLITLIFNESASVNFNAKNFSFQINNSEVVEANLLKNYQNKDLLFSLAFKNNIKAGTKVEITILIDDLRSESSAFLNEYKKSGELLEFIIEESDSNSILDIPWLKISTLVKVGVSSSLCSSIVSNPAASWTLLNTIQLLAFLPLNSNPLTPNLIKFFKGIAEFNIIPNTFDNFYPSDTSDSPYLEARRFGLKTSVFVLNIGPILLLFIAIICLWPISFIISKVITGKFALKTKKLLQNYKFSFFLRFWTQTYLEIGIYAIIQLKVRVNHWLGYLNQLIATMCFIGVALTPYITVMGSYFSENKIIEADRKFLKNWGSLFTEFHCNKGFWSSQYYFLYFSRRLAYLLAQIYFNEYLFLQGALNIVWSFIMILFLLVYRPFKSSAILSSNLISEFGILFVIAMSYGFILNIENKTKERLEIAIMFITLSAIFLQFLISMWFFIDSFITLFKKFLEERNCEIARHAQRKLGNHYPQHN